MRTFGLSLLVLSFVSSCRHPSLPPIKATTLPTFESAHVCAANVGPMSGVPDELRIERDCTSIDPGSFRRLVLEAVPGDKASWKGGRLVVARSTAQGDRYFFASNYGAFFERPGLQGTYTVPKPLRHEWETLIFGVHIQ